MSRQAGRGVPSGWGVPSRAGAPKGAAPKTAKDERKFESFKQEEEFDMRLMLVGRTGSGKSSAANTILGINAFKIGGGAFSSTTRKCQVELAKRRDVRVRVLDTCGLFDTEMMHEDVVTEIKRSLIMVAPGPHAFVLVIPLEPFTDEQRKTMQYLESLFPNFYDQTIVLFTKCEGKDIHQLIRSSREIDELCQKVSRRYVVFSNTEEDQGKKDGMTFQLLDAVYDLYRQRNRAFFTCLALERAEAAAERGDEEIRRKAYEEGKSTGILMEEALAQQVGTMIEDKMDLMATALTSKVLVRWINLKQLYTKDLQTMEIDVPDLYKTEIEVGNNK